MRFQGLFWYLENSTFSSSNNFFVNLNGFLSNARQPFLFLTTVSLHFPLVIWQGFVSFILDNCRFIKVLSPGISLSCFFRRLCSNLSWPFSLCLLLAVLFGLCWSSDPKCSKHTACIIFVKECNFTPIGPFRLVCKMKDNSSSRVFHLVLLALGQFIRIAFFSRYILYIYIYKQGLALNNQLSMNQIEILNLFVCWKSFKK